MILSKRRHADGDGDSEVRKRGRVEAPATTLVHSAPGPVPTALVSSPPPVPLPVAVPLVPALALVPLPVTSPSPVPLPLPVTSAPVAVPSPSPSPVGSVDAITSDIVVGWFNGGARHATELIESCQSYPLLQGEMRAVYRKLKSGECPVSACDEVWAHLKCITSVFGDPTTHPRESHLYVLELLKLRDSIRDHKNDITELEYVNYQCAVQARYTANLARYRVDKSLMPAWKAAELRAALQVNSLVLADVPRFMLVDNDLPYVDKGADLVGFVFSTRSPTGRRSRLHQVKSGGGHGAQVTYKHVAGLFNVCNIHAVMRGADQESLIDSIGLVVPATWSGPSQVFDDVMEYQLGLRQNKFTFDIVRDDATQAVTKPVEPATETVEPVTTPVDPATATAPMEPAIVTTPAEPVADSRQFTEFIGWMVHAARHVTHAQLTHVARHTHATRTQHTHVARHHTPHARTLSYHVPTHSHRSPMKLCSRRATPRGATRSGAGPRSPR